MSFFNRKRDAKKKSEYDDNKLLAKEFQTFVVEHNSLASDYIALHNKQLKAWQIFGTIGFIFGLGGITWHLTNPIVEKVPYTVLVDRLTGATEILQSVPDQNITQDEVTNKYWVAEYIRNYESYDHYTIQNTYDRTLSLSGDNVAFQFKKIYSGNNSRDAVLGTSQTRKVHISNVMIDSVGEDGSGVARVRFKTETSQITGTPLTEYWVATVAFQYDKGEMDAGKRLLNPLGFKVLTYSVGNEVVQ